MASVVLALQLSAMLRTQVTATAMYWQQPILGKE